mmetsp:Transcript_2217/g.5726  ORF Transcript_2217/g.5726 Transcript_2217/m.5726 type:complete len:249 (-) Transcript_2217:1957-2703(-)
MDAESIIVVDSESFVLHKGIRIWQPLRHVGLGSNILVDDGMLLMHAKAVRTNTAIAVVAAFKIVRDDRVGPVIPIIVGIVTIQAELVQTFSVTIIMVCSVKQPLTRAHVHLKMAVCCLLWRIRLPSKHACADAAADFAMDAAAIIPPDHAWRSRVAVKRLLRRVVEIELRVGRVEGWSFVAFLDCSTCIVVVFVFAVATIWRWPLLVVCVDWNRSCAAHGRSLSCRCDGEDVCSCFVVAADFDKMGRK